MAVAITVRAENESVVMELLQHYLNLDYAKVFDEIGAYGVYSTQMRFENQNDVEGNPWKMSWRAMLESGKTGRDTGRLMGELSYNLIPNGVEWGSNLNYAHVFHYGAHIIPKTAEYLLFAVKGNYRKVKEVNIPSRTFLGMNKTDEDEILNIIEGFIHG